ncbi:MAG TPA: tetratricopeptide repeat protein [Rhizomicrobium sp.]|nr:tetratricopeptide repeat protein [Rhizomicrobium sp.]
MTAAARTYEDGLKLSAQGRHALAIKRYEQALVQAPNDARVLFALGNTARALGLARPAEEFFRRVLSLEPERIEALVNLANLLRSQGDFSSAAALLTPALFRNPTSSELWLTLGSVHREIGDQAEAVRHYREALSHRPNYPQALGNLADLIADDGKIEEALALYDRALRTDKDNAQARLNRAVLHLCLGNLKEGWRDYAARLKLPGKVPVPDHKLPRWNGELLKRQRLLVTAEQGVGDHLMFASMMPDLAERAAREGGSVILECEPRLTSLFARSFPSTTVRPWDSETRGGIPLTHYGWLKGVGGATRFTEMGTLARHLRPTVASFPSPNTFLVPDSGEVARWRETFGSAIGICWRSGKAGGHRALQYAPLESWAAFLRTWTGTVVSVQYDATPDEIAALESMSGRKIVVPHCIDQKNELDRACALLSALDAVISAPTAVSWLSAGAGVPTYKVLYDKSWTGFGKNYEPFGPSCICVMPKNRGDWTDGFAQIHAALSQRPSQS